MRTWTLQVVTLVAVAAPVHAAAADSLSSRYVLIVGNNQSSEPDIPTLNYADDDAVLYVRLFAPYAAEVELLTVLDDASQRRHPGVAAHARVPTRAQLRASLARLYRAIENDPGETELVFVFVGHGGVDDEGKGYVHLFDGRLTRADLFAEVIAKSPADFTHIIIDACNAFSLVGGRGKGDDDDIALDALFTRFLAGHQLEAYPSVGVIAATSENRETHEWSRIGAGVFSYQVRSALTGAADINRDGRVEYSEIAAFVDAANAGLPAVGKRLATFAWPPPRDRRRPLIDTNNRAGTRRIELSDRLVGHYFLESESGERWAELHSAAAVTLTVPAAIGFYLRDGSHETSVPPGDEDVVITEVPSDTYTLAARGAVDRAFERGLFAVPFSRDYYRGYVSGRSQFLRVDLRADPVAVANIADSGLVVAAQYFAGTSPVAEKKFEQGGRARISIGVGDGDLWSVGASIEGAYALVRPGVGVGRFSVYLGAGLRQAWLDRLALGGGIDVGYAIIAIAADPSSIDLTVPAMRARLDFEVRLTRSVWALLGVTYSAYLVSMPTNDIRPSPLGHVGVVWR